MAAEDRYRAGAAKLEEVVGAAGQRMIDALSRVSPDLARFTVEYSYGDIYSRPQLDLKSRQVAAVAALTVLGSTLPQLKVHVNGALNVGWTPEQIIEVIMQMTLYAGFAVVTNALVAAGEVFAERGLNASRPVMTASV